MPNGLAASLEGVGGEGALTCCSAGPCWKEMPTPYLPSTPQTPSSVWPHPDEGTRVNRPMSTRPGYPGSKVVGLGQRRDVIGLSWRKGWPGGFNCHRWERAGGAGIGAQTWAAQRTRSRACPQLSRYPRRPVGSVPCPQPTTPGIGRGSGGRAATQWSGPSSSHALSPGPLSGPLPRGRDAWPHGAPIRLPKALTAGLDCPGEWPGGLGRTL